MSLYINHENQRILWESIQQHPSIDLIPQHDRNDWFKNIVKNVYETIPRPWFHRKITTEELNLLNQSTIRRMLGDLKPPAVSLPPGNNTERYGDHMSGQGAMMYNEASMDVGIKSAHTPMIQQRYLEKQQELESMLRQPNPTTPVDFKMSTLDEPITNMEELLQKHAREREQDLALDPRVTTMTPQRSINASDASASFQASNSSGDLRSPSELVVQGLSAPLPSQNNIKINITEEPVTISIMDLVVEGIHPSDQTSPVALPPSKLVVEGLRPSDQTSPVAKLPSELVVEGLRPSDQTLPVIKKASALKKHISFQDEDPNADVRRTVAFGSSDSSLEFTYQIPEHVLLEQKILKLEQEMTVLKRLVFGVYKGMSVCPNFSGGFATFEVSSEGGFQPPLPMQTLLLETSYNENS